MPRLLVQARTSDSPLRTERTLSYVEAIREATEQDMRHDFVRESDFARMVAGGEVVDAPTLAAYLLVRLSREAT